MNRKWLVGWVALPALLLLALVLASSDNQAQAHGGFYFHSYGSGYYYSFGYPAYGYGYYPVYPRYYYYPRTYLGYGYYNPWCW